MPIVRFTGKVFPLAHELTFDNIPAAAWESPEIGLEMAFTIQIVKSVVEVDCELNKFDREHLSHVYMRAYDLARTVVNTMAFALGIGFTVILDTLIDDQGTVFPVTQGQPELAARCTAYKVMTSVELERLEYQKMLALIMADPPLFMALNDLIQTIIISHEAPINCGRVLDGLRKMVTPGIEPKQGWPIFQGIVNADEKYLNFVSENSKNPRHGDRTFIPGEVNREAIRRMWNVMNRFLEYRKGGNQPLPLADFPMLLG